MAKQYFQQLGIGVASLTFGVALSIFIYTAGTGLLGSTQAVLLYITSFLLMLRFWWRYTELFARHIPSQTYFQFLVDFLVSLFGISTVLFVNSIQTWTLLGVGAMVSSTVRCGLSLPKTEEDGVKRKLRKTIFGSAFMFVVLGLVYMLSFTTDNLLLSWGVLATVVAFVVSSSLREM